jgi:hypothetical protein
MARARERVNSQHHWSNQQEKKSLRAIIQVQGELQNERWRVHVASFIVNRESRPSQLPIRVVELNDTLNIAR